ncbi:MAG: hypothetical protein ACK44W_06880 [Planctomycetota bacterium]
MARISPEDFLQLVYDEVNKAVRTIPQLVFEGQVNLGPVEVKDPDADRRLRIKNDGTDNAAVVTANALPLPAGAAREVKQDVLIALLTSGTPEHRNGTASTSPAEVTFSGPTKHVVVQNPGSADKLEVSFDGGTTYMLVLGKGHVSFPCRVTRVHVRATDGSIPYNILAMV